MIWSIHIPLRAALENAARSVILGVSTHFLRIRPASSLYRLTFSRYICVFAARDWRESSINSRLAFRNNLISGYNFRIRVLL